MKDERWYSIVGSKIEKRLLEKHGTLSRATKFVGDISVSELSKIIAGERKPNAERTLKFIRLGVDKQWFDLYYKLTEINVDELTKKEMTKVIETLQFQVLQYSELVQILSKRVDKLMTK